MNDRTALLAAIRDSPGQLTPRLVYADWLEEFGSTDLDAATVEFIRVSCSGPASKLMPPAAFHWIAMNWTRLVPTLLAKRGGEVCPWHREGRTIVVRYLGRIEEGWDATPPKRHRPIALSFHLGFLRVAKIWSWYTAKYVHPLLLADQPLCRGEGPGWIHRSAPSVEEVA